MKTQQITPKTRAILVGAFILIAYGVLANALTESKIIVMLADIISGLAVIGIAVLIFPLFKNTNHKLNIGYLLLKMIEGGLMITGGLFFLKDSLHDARDFIYEGIHLYVFIVSGLIFYYLLYKSKIIPKFISIWGTIAIFALLLQTILGLLDLESPIIDGLLVLIITNEVFLAIWLMIKGFNLSINRNDRD